MQDAFGAELICLHWGEYGVDHCELFIRGQRIMLNDRGGYVDKERLGTFSMVVLFDSAEELRACWQHMEDGAVVIDPMAETEYSALVINFYERFGIWWGFMVG